MSSANVRSFSKPTLSTASAIVGPYDKATFGTGTAVRRLANSILTVGLAPGTVYREPAFFRKPSALPLQPEI